MDTPADLRVIHLVKLREMDEKKPVVFCKLNLPLSRQGDFGCSTNLINGICNLLRRSGVLSAEKVSVSFGNLRMSAEVTVTQNLRPAQQNAMALAFQQAAQQLLSHPRCIAGEYGNVAYETAMAYSQTLTFGDIEVQFSIDAPNSLQASHLDALFNAKPQRYADRIVCSVAGPVGDLRLCALGGQRLTPAILKTVIRMFLEPLQRHLTGRH